jgi:hypothetical protein
MTDSAKREQTDVNNSGTKAPSDTRLTHACSRFDREMRELQSLSKRSAGNADLQTVAGMAVEQLRTLGGMDPEAEPVRYGWVKKGLTRSVVLLGEMAR